MEKGVIVSLFQRRVPLSAILNGELKNAEYDILPGFKLKIPKSVTGIDPNLLDPRKCWKDQVAYNKTTKILIEKFIENFKQFEVSKNIQQAEPEMMR